MNILILSDGYRRKDDRTRINLLKKLNTYCNLIIYGPNENDKSFSPIQYNKDINIFNTFNPDIILFILYNEICLNWIPEYVYKSSIPTVIIEEDHYTENGLKHFEYEVLRTYYKFDLIIRRHYYKEKQNLNSVWWPFSACSKEFFENKVKRKKLIGFAGSSVGPYYNIRRKAIDILAINNLVEACIVAKNYSEFIRSFIGFLTCAGGYIHTPMAKAFETMLSGTALLTNFMYNDKILFGNKKCYFEYKDDCSDIVEQANIILNDEDQVKEVTENALEICLERHTDEHRIKELYNILEALLYGKEIPRIWGQ